MSWKKVDVNLSCSLSQNEMPDNARAGTYWPTANQQRTNSVDFRQINSPLARF